MIDARGAVLIGMPKQIDELLALLQKRYIDLRGANLVMLSREVGAKELAQALESMPKTKKVKKK